MAKKFSKPHLSRIINGDIQLSAGLGSEEKTRFDMVLLAKYPEYNRSTLQKYIKSGNARINGEIILKPNAQISTEDQVSLHPPQISTMPKVHVIYEDEHVIVLDKPTGLLSVSKGNFNPEPTLEEFGLIVHRLDRDTSGVIILAKDQKTRSYLQRQFQQRKTHKTYFAITQGIPKIPQAVIDIPLARNLKKPTTFLPDPEGREAVTEYRVIKQDAQHALIELKPKTGRTHQLRVHLKHLSTPILGDKVYGEANDSRMYLHAASLEITIPGPEGGIRKVFEAPLPKEFSDAIE